MERFVLDVTVHKVNGITTDPLAYFDEIRKHKRKHQTIVANFGNPYRRDNLDDLIKVEDRNLTFMRICELHGSFIRTLKICNSFYASGICYEKCEKIVEVLRNMPLIETLELCGLRLAESPEELTSVKPVHLIHLKALKWFNVDLELLDFIQMPSVVSLDVGSGLFERLDHQFLFNFLGRCKKLQTFSLSISRGFNAMFTSQSLAILASLQLAKFGLLNNTDTHMRDAYDESSMKIFCQFISSQASKRSRQ